MFSSMAHLHIVGYAIGQMFCFLISYIRAYVQGKVISLTRFLVMGTFQFSHTILLEQEELLVSLPLPGLYCILWPPNEFEMSLLYSLDLSSHIFLPIFTS